MEKIRSKTGRIMFHTTFYYEIDAMNGRIKGSYDEISHKIPIMTWYKWRISFQRSFDGVLAVHSAVLLTIRVHHIIDIESAFG